MKLIDIGANLMSPSFDRDRDEVIKAAALAGVSPLIITGSSERSSAEAASYACLYNAGNSQSLFYTAGVHPHEVKNCGKETIDRLRELCRGRTGGRPGAVSGAVSGEVSGAVNGAVNGAISGAKAVGECGLDYNRDFSPRDVQRRWFVEQAELAAELSLPLFLHERDAFSDFSGILREYAASVPAVVVHCFTGTGAELEYYLSLGCYIGITGWICDERRGIHLTELVKMIPADRLLLETDAPYLLPRDLPFKVRNRRNEPKYLPHIAETVARLLGKGPVQLAEETFANSKRFFGIITA